MRAAFKVGANMVKIGALPLLPARKQPGTSWDNCCYPPPIGMSIKLFRAWHYAPPLTWRGRGIKPGNGERKRERKEAGSHNNTELHPIITKLDTTLLLLIFELRMLFMLLLFSASHLLILIIFDIIITINNSCLLIIHVFIYM